MPSEHVHVSHSMLHFFEPWKFTCDGRVAISIFYQWQFFRSIKISRLFIYTFFYALPIGLLLIFLLPFHRSIYHKTTVKLKSIHMVLLMAFGVILTLGGPLNPGIILIFGMLILLKILAIRFMAPNKSIVELSRRVNLSDRQLVVLGWVSLLSLYYLYVGRFNDMNLLDPVSLLDRYLKVPQGIFDIMTTKIGPALLLVMIGLNVYVITRHYRGAEGEPILTALKWVGIFTIIYLLLLPLGGYRIYRPNIVRYDTFMPVVISWIFAYGLSALYLLRNLTDRHRARYLTTLFVFLAIFTIADRTSKSKYLCERNALEEIQNTPGNMVMLENDCPVMEFRMVTSPGDSDLNADLLLHWRVAREKKLFYQKVAEKIK